MRCNDELRAKPGCAAYLDFSAQQGFDYSVHVGESQAGAPKVDRVVK